MTFDLDTIVLMAATLTVLISAWLWQRNPNIKFDILDLISEDGKLSLFRTGQLVALLTSTWGYISLVRSGDLSELYFLTYMATWAGANVAKVALDARKPPEPKA